MKLIDARALGFLALAAFGATGCLGDPVEPRVFKIADATLSTRPTAPTLQPARGFSALGLGSGRDGLIYVPNSYNAASPAPLLLLLHSSNESSAQWRSDHVSSLAEEFGVVLLIPDSRERTWDFILNGRFAADVKFIDSALGRAFNLCNIDASRLGIGGFSDGASYALSLGVINGDLFTRVIGFSPGFVFAPERRGEPSVYLTHGLQDPHYPASNTRNNIVPTLRGAGYAVEYVEFTGGHVVPLDIARGAFRWLAAVGQPPVALTRNASFEWPVVSAPVGR